MSQNTVHDAKEQEDLIEVEGFNVDASPIIYVEDLENRNDLNVFDYHLNSFKIQTRGDQDGPTHELRFQDTSKQSSYAEPLSFGCQLKSAHGGSKWEEKFYDPLLINESYATVFDQKKVTTPQGGSFLISSHQIENSNEEFSCSEQDQGWRQNLRVNCTTPLATAKNLCTPNNYELRSDFLIDARVQPKTTNQKRMDPDIAQSKVISKFKAFAPKKLNFDVDGSNKENFELLQANLPTLQHVKSGKKPKIAPVTTRFKGLQTTKSVQFDLKKSSLNITKDSNISTGKKHTPNGVRYYKQLDFVYPRTCFRIMNNYYKEKFQECLKQKVSQTPHLKALKSTAAICKEDMNIILEQFIQQQGVDLNILSDDQRLRVIQTMMGFCFAHRFEKDDHFLVESLKDGNIEFSVIRDTMYMYSKRAKDAFFARPIETFLFLRFAQSEEFEKAVEGRDAIERLLRENDILIATARESLQQMVEIQNEDLMMVQMFIKEIGQI